MPESEGHELVDGELVEVGMGSKSSWIAGYLARVMGNFVEDAGVGTVFPQESGIQIWPNRPALVRKPDLVFVRRGRMSGGLPDGWLRITPDLVVEVVSPNDYAANLEEKLREFREAGIQLVWVIYPHTANARIYRADGSNDEVEPGGALDGEHVVPGFSLSLAELFQRASEQV